MSRGKSTCGPRTTLAGTIAISRRYRYPFGNAPGSFADAVRVMLPVTVCPAEGAAIETDGGMASTAGALFIVTVTPDDVLLFPAASLATAVSMCEPFTVVVLFQSTVYGATVTSGPRSLP